MNKFEKVKEFISACEADYVPGSKVAILCEAVKQLVAALESDCDCKCCETSPVAKEKQPDKPVPAKISTSFFKRSKKVK